MKDKAFQQRKNAALHNDSVTSKMAIREFLKSALPKLHVNGNHYDLLLR